METKYVLNCGSYDFIFALEQRRYIKIEEENPDGFPFIYCKLYRADNKDFFWEWEGQLLPEPKIEFQLIYADQVNIKGYICLFHSYETGDNFVFMDAKFGLCYEEHFEGNILQIDYGPIPDPIIPDPPVPGPKPTPIPPDERIEAEGFADLFPYLYMQYWPDLQPEDKIFLVTIPPGLSTSVFYTNLQNLYKAPNARQNMEAEALAYINCTGSYAGCFIQSIQDLTYPLNIFPEIYNEIYNEELIEEEAIILRVTNKKQEGEEELYITTTYPDQIQRIWENIIALNIIEGYESFKYDQLTKILIVDHIVAYLGNPPTQKPPHWLRKLIHASLVLPDTIFPLPKFDVPLTPLYPGTIVPYAIGDLQMVQHQPKGYEPGEIAHIENVLAGEVKKTTQRKKEMVKDSLENTFTNTSTHKKDDYGDLLEKQVYKTIVDSITDTYNYNALTVSYGPPTTGTYGGSVTNTKDRNMLEQNPAEFAKKILSQTISQLDEKISERRAHVIRNETEESVAHIIDNRNGNQNIRGIYYWLNRIYEMKLVNYGHRFLLEFIIDKPAIVNTDQIKGPFAFPPVPPNLLNPPIQSYQDISPENYIQLGQQYGLYDLPFPPAPNKIVTGKLSGEEYRLTTDIEIPDGYLPNILNASCNFPTTTPAITGTLIAGEVQKTISSATITQLQDPLQLFVPPPTNPLLPIAAENLVLPVLLEVTSPPLSFTVPVNGSSSGSPALAPLTCPTLPTVYVSLTLWCQCSDEFMNKWKQQIFMLIQNGYETSVKKYRAEMKHQTRTNPNMVSRLIQKMVIGSCKDVLWEQHILINGTPPPAPPAPSQDTVNKPAYNQFYNEAFEWDKMSYSVESLATTNLKEDLAEHLDDTMYNDQLEKFLSANQIKVIIPIKQLFHYRMMYYLNAGLIAYGEDHLTPIFTKDEQMAVKLKKVFEIFPEVEISEIERWKIAVPTEMQWLADSSQLPVIH